MCSHAYAVKKYMAKTWFKQIYSVGILKLTEEDFITDQLSSRLPVDWAFLNYFKDSRNFNSLHAASLGWDTGYDDSDDFNETGLIMKLHKCVKKHSNDQFEVSRLCQNN